MATITFAAKVIKAPGVLMAGFSAPARIASPDKAYIVRNPFTGHVLWLTPKHIVNVINDVAAVRIDAQWSGRMGKLKRGHREFINPDTGNTFQVKTHAITKETA